MSHPRGKYVQDPQHPEWHIATVGEQVKLLDKIHQVLDNWNKPDDNIVPSNGEHNWSPKDDDELPDDMYNRFYMHATDGKGHKMEMRVKLDEVLYAAITRYVESDDFPYRSGADFIRDWIIKGLLIICNNKDKIKNDPTLRSLARQKELSRRLDFEDITIRDLESQCRRIDEYIDRGLQSQASCVLLDLMDETVRKGMPVVWQDKLSNDVVPKYCHLIGLRPKDLLRQDVES